MIFFDEGHKEYRELLRKSMVYMPVGSAVTNSPRNFPLDMCIEDGNEKNSRHCHFTQLADLIAYAALAKIRYECGSLDPKQLDRNVHQLYDAIPLKARNLKAAKNSHDGIVRLG